MSERLTKRLANGGVMYDNGEYWRVCYPWNEHCLNSIDRMAIKLCEIEDKIEQGDVVEVVRCKDCHYCEEAHYEEEGEKPYIKLKCKWSNYSHQPNDYCSFGERGNQMNEHDATEIAYKNGYREAVRDMREMLTNFFDQDEALKYIEVDAEYINECIDQIAEKMIGDER